MAQHPMLPLWTDAYLADTSHLSTLEHGAYLLLLMAMWRTKDGTLPDDDRQLARFSRLTPTQWRRVKPTIMAFFRPAGEGQITQGRLHDELKAVRQHSQSQSRKARSRWDAKPLSPNDPPNAAASERHMPKDTSGNASPTHSPYKQAVATVAPTSEAPRGSPDGAGAAPAGMSLDRSQADLLADQVAAILGATDQRWAFTAGVALQRHLDAGATPALIVATARAIRARRDAAHQPPPTDPRYLDGPIRDAIAAAPAADADRKRRIEAITAGLPTGKAEPAPLNLPAPRRRRAC